MSAFNDRDSSSKAGKIKWVQKNTRIPKSRILVVKRAQKQAYATHNGQASVLIDDYIKNIKEWENKSCVKELEVKYIIKYVTNNMGSPTKYRKQIKTLKNYLEQLNFETNSISK